MSERKTLVRLATVGSWIAVCGPIIIAGIANNLVLALVSICISGGVLIASAASAKLAVIGSQNPPAKEKDDSAGGAR